MDPEPRQSRTERESQVNLILHWVSTKLLRGVPDNWARIDLKVTMASTVDDFVFTTVLYDGTAAPHEMPLELRQAFVDIRDLLYEPGEGTWFSARFTMDPPDHYRVTFNFDVDPVWDPPIAPELYAKDLTAYSRSPENIPAWLHVRLGEAPPAIPPAGSYEEHVRYTKHVSDQLKQTLPAGWTYAQVQFREVGGHAETNAIIQNVAHLMEPWSPPDAVTDRFRELRAATRDADQGPWYSAKLELRYSGEEKLTTNRTDEPQWLTPPEASAYQAEAELSAVERLPDWLRAHLES